MTFSVSFSGATKTAAKEDIARRSAEQTGFAPFAAGVALVVDALPEGCSVSGGAHGHVPGPGDSGSISLSLSVSMPATKPADES